MFSANFQLCLLHETALDTIRYWCLPYTDFLGVLFAFFGLCILERYYMWSALMNLSVFSFFMQLLWYY